MTEDRAFQLLQLGARLEPQFVDEHRTCGAEHGERVALASAAVQREHLEPAQALTQRVLRDQRIELGRGLGRPPAVDVGAEPALQRSETQLVEARRDRAHGREVGDVGERRAAPERQRHCQLRCCVGGAASLVISHPGRGVLLEPVQVQRAVGRDQRVATTVRGDRIAAQQLAQVRDVALDDIRRGIRRPLVPDPVDQAVDRDGLIGVREQDREHGALMAAGERDRLTIDERLERSEDPEFDAHRPILQPVP